MFPMAITPYYFSLIDKRTFRSDPVFLQSVPSPLELEIPPMRHGGPAGRR